MIYKIIFRISGPLWGESTVHRLLWPVACLTVFLMSLRFKDRQHFHWGKIFPFMLHDPLWFGRGLNVKDMYWWALGIVIKNFMVPNIFQEWIYAYAKYRIYMVVQRYAHAKDDRIKKTRRDRGCDYQNVFSFKNIDNISLDKVILWGLELSRRPGTLWSCKPYEKHGNRLLSLPNVAFDIFRKIYVWTVWVN